MDAHPKFEIAPINGNFTNKSILSITQFAREDFEIVFAQTAKMRDVVLKQGSTNLLKGKVVACVFYEPSSRTFISFLTAAQRVGAGTIPLLGMAATSVAKGETLQDTIRTIGCNADAIVLRHPEKGAVSFVAGYSYVPILNAGDGNGEHPTQALMDMFTIKQKHGSLDNITGVLVGDILNGRTTHSLILGLSLYKNVTLYLLSPESLKLTREDYEKFTKRGIKLVEISSEKDMPKDAHFWYWTRVQKERFVSIEEYEKVKHSFILTPDTVSKYAGKDTILMHPLPRVGEIEEAVDTDPRAIYIETQMRNGVYTRMALLTLITGKTE